MSSTETNCKSRRPPQMGAIVIFHQPVGEESMGNGSFKHPAIVTRVWGENCINVKVLPDGGSVADRTSIPRAFFDGLNWGFEE